MPPTACLKPTAWCDLCLMLSWHEAEKSMLPYLLGVLRPTSVRLGLNADVVPAGEPSGHVKMVPLFDALGWCLSVDGGQWL